MLADLRPDALLASLLEIVREISIAGIADVMIMTIFIYAGLVWLRRSRAKKVVQGIFITGLFYLFSRQFNLYLTSVILEGFFAVALVAVIVIFRDELRRLFEKVARFRPATRFGRQEPAPLAGLKGILTRTLTDLARDRVGALVVIRHKESIDIHLEGGTPLSGEPSEALLKSLFDDHSIGHDGAVVIEDGLVKRFACHLPLSTSFDKLGSRGTRHAAALGLAERSDALCLIVSEERGMISAAWDGELRELSGGDELAALLADHLEEAPTPRPFRALLRKDYGTKVSAVGLSLLLWLVLVHGARQTMQRITLPLDLNDVPAGFLATVEPQEVQVTLIGPRRNFYFFSKASAQVTLSLAEMQSGSVIKRLQLSDVTIPKEFTLRGLKPTRVRVKLVPAAAGAKAPGPKASNRSKR